MRMTKGNSLNAGSNKALRLVVIPTNPISAYEAAGIDWLESYYNPTGMFAEVFAVSPLEKGRRQAHGMTILGVKERNFGTVLRELKPDVVRAYGGYWQSDLACLHRIPGVPVIVSQHEPLPILPHKSIRYADLVICVSPSTAEAVKARGVEPGRIRVLPNRVDTRKFHPIADGNALVQVGARFPPGRHILHVGRRSPEKNLDTLIRALRHLPQDYSCISVGQGSETARCKALASQLAVGSRCHWIESVPNSELPQWYSWCDCMCTPSRYEGFGIVFVEAAACGAAIVTSDIAPMNEYLTHGVSGHLVPRYEDPAALAQAIQAVCEDAPYRQRLSQGAVAAAKRFDSAAIDLQEHGIYAEALRLSPRTIPASSLRRIRLARNLDRIGEVARTLRSGAAHPRRFLAGVRPRAGAAARAVFHGICRCVNRALRVAPAWVMPGRAYALLLQRVGGRSGAERVLEWLRRAELGSGGIYVHSASGVAYPEVSGYLVPTLLKHGEVRLSQRILTWLLAIQRADGAYPDYEGTPRVFDTGQVLRGLLAGADTIPGAEDAARRSMEYLFGQMVDQGRGGFGNCYDKSIPEAVNLYVLPPLIEAARRFNDPRVISAANACLEYLCRHETFLRVDDLTHFLCYELDALIDLGRGDLAAPVLQRMLGAQRPDGAVRGVGGARWVCSPGLAQLAICWYKTGHRKAADRALAWLERHQRLSGGFLGSYGRGAAYFQDVELSWAAKFFLEAHLLRISSFIEEHIEEFPSHVDRSDGRCRSVAAVVKPGDRILECGCGKGRFLKAIKDALPDVECTGVDISEKMLAHLPPGIRGRQGALEQLPLPSASYDVVFSVEAIEHSINKEAAIAEMIRVAKPGGFVIVVDKQKSHWGALKCPPWERWPAREEIVKLLQRECDDVSAQPVDYGVRDVDGLMLVWQGRK
jgi:malonyl-CoA O-methyltransferase